MQRKEGGVREIGYWCVGLLLRRGGDFGIGGEDRMSRYYGSGASCSSGGGVPSSSAPDISDEEIAYQLQLEALAESSHHYSVPQFQASSSSQPASSSSRSRVVRKFGVRNPRQYRDQALVAPHVFTDEILARRKHKLVAPTPPLALNNALNLERDDALSSDGVSLLFSTESTRQRHWLDRVFGVLPSENTGSSGGREPVLDMECGICTESQPHTSFISTSGCNHEYCSDCCKRHAEVKVSSGSSQIQCPHHDCRHNFDITQCRELLSQPSFDILTTRQTEAAIPSSQKVYCPFQDCSAFMEKPANNSRGSQFVECGTCHRGFCLNCNTPWHANKTCAEFGADVTNANQSGDEKLRDLVRKEKWQVCTECQRVISLRDGCYHMTCLCGNEFCYICGAKWMNKVPSCTCKLWDESNIIRMRPGRRARAPLVRANVNLNANPFANGNINANPLANANPVANANANRFVNANANLLANPFVQIPLNFHNHN